MSLDIGVFDALLLTGVLLAAVAAVLVPRRTASVAVFLVFGLLLALLWARLDAPDIALAEAVLGGGVTGALLVDALASKQPHAPPRRLWTVVVGIVAGTIAFLAAACVVSRLSGPTGELPRLVDDQIATTGAEHPVTAVLLNFRSFDTLLEIAVVMAAVFAATAVSDRSWARELSASGELRTIAMALLPVVALLAVWMLIAGTTRPGGAFQAGAMVGAGLVIAHLTGTRHASTRGRWGEALIVVGLVAFILLAFSTAVAGEGWLVLGESWASAAILGIEAVLAVSIGVGLARIFLANRNEPGEAR
ncbi:hypothetical protein BHE97_19250 [Aeromicrobium sp. PE09-221]|uniref:hydrogenase subunit MbhD domain-containing protein n=1 Tax=Aeromicrobium sp. PE09-221 TaxID=1898043 RepID=UPI000B3E7E84|nr:hydrogenase subunit MbhD domain-containing protein [Aeromicrobium sp. PE09-221]OUZ06261.1 hypothetical protein BHE97_19250 [Aeromicrobium sp. PE09-221]